MLSTIRLRFFLPTASTALPGKMRPSFTSFQPAWVRIMLPSIEAYTTSPSGNSSCRIACSCWSSKASPKAFVTRNTCVVATSMHRNLCNRSFEPTVNITDTRPRHQVLQVGADEKTVGLGLERMVIR